MTAFIYILLAFVFYIVMTGLAGIVRGRMPPRVEAALFALLIAATWAPVRWWGAETAGTDWLQGWHPLIGTWLLNEPANRPDLTAASFGLTALASYAAIRWWAGRRHLPIERPPDATLH